MTLQLCECGCGLPAPIAKRTNSAFGHSKGQPTRFIRGHNPGRKATMAEVVAKQARHKAARKKRYQRNREAVLAQQRQYRRDNSTRMRANEKVRRDKLGDVLRARKRQYAANNREQQRQRSRRHYRDNKQAYMQRASARKRVLSTALIEHVDRKVVYQMHGGRCGICGKFIRRDLSLVDQGFHVDHIIPLSKGGVHGYINVQPSHPYCNDSKGSWTSGLLSTVELAEASGYEVMLI